MKKVTGDASDNKKKSQVNIGYENNKKTVDEDDHEENRVQTSATGLGEGPVENEKDTEGLRSESGSKSLGKEKGNNEED